MQHRLERSRNKDIFGNIVLDETEPLVADQVLDILDSSGDQVVDADNFVVLRDQVIAEVRTQKACR
jgi:hypothetical protein